MVRAVSGISSDRGEIITFTVNINYLQKVNNYMNMRGYV